MRRADAFGLALVLAVGGAGAAWIWSESRPRRPEQRAAPREDFDSGGALAYHREALGTVAPKVSGAGVEARWVDLNGEAIAALESGELERAVELFERCLDGVPDQPVFASNLAEALARLARREYEDRAGRDSAVLHLGRALALHPQREDLRALLERWMRQIEAEQDFWTDESEHFLLSYDGTREEILNRGHSQVLDGLERAYLEFGELFGRFPVEDGRPKIEVLLYRRERFRSVTGMGHWAGGVFDGKVRIPLEDLEREKEGLQSVLRHELLHAFVQAAGGRDVPGWLNEGLAQWLESPDPDDRRGRVERARRRIAGRPPFALAELAGSLASSEDEEEIGRAYSQSLALVDYLARFYGERCLFEMVEGCARESACEQTFLTRTGVSLDGVLQDFADGL